MGCAADVVKYLLFIANLLFALAGLALLIVGILYLVNIGEVKDVIPKELKSIEAAPISTIVIGCIIFLVAFMGCCGAIRESTCLLNSFAVVLLLILVAQIAIGVYAFLKVKNSDDLETQIQSQIKDLISRYNSSSDPSKEALDYIQTEFKCCGGKGPSDYDLNSIPKSCCKNRKTTVVPCVPYEKGCTNEVKEYLQRIANIVGYVLIGTLVFELLSAIFAFCLSTSIRNEYRRGNYYEDE